MSRPIEFYFDFISPYGHLAAEAIEGLAGEFGRDVVWRPFLLGVTVLQVMGLKPLTETPLKGDYVRLDKPRMARLLGIPLADPDLRGVNGVAAARAYYWLVEAEPARAKALARRLLRRLWVAGADITPVDAVVEEAAACGVAPAPLRAALGRAEVKDRLRAEVDRAVARGVFGSPFFIVDDQPIWGVDRLWMIRHWLEHGSWEPAPGLPAAGRPIEAEARRLSPPPAARPCGPCRSRSTGSGRPGRTGRGP